MNSEVHNEFIVRAISWREYFCNGKHVLIHLAFFTIRLFLGLIKTDSKDSGISIMVLYRASNKSPSKAAVGLNEFLYIGVNPLSFVVYD